MRRRRLRRRYGHVYKREPLVKVVVFPGGPGKRKGTRIPWVAEAYDANGYVHSSVRDFDRAYVERKIAEWWPDLPVEQAPPGAMPRTAGMYR